MYSYSFDEQLQQEWEWSERFSPQPEILRYLNHVADRFDLRRDIRLNTRVVAAHFDDARDRWRIETAGGDSFHARFCVMAAGNLSEPNRPDFEGVDEFEGLILHTSRWPRDGVDLVGRRVGVIGTGSTGVQLIPQVAKEAEHLYVFQRTPNYSWPARNRTLTSDFQAQVKARYPEMRAGARVSGGGSYIDWTPSSAAETAPEERRRTYEAAWERGGAALIYAFNDLLVDREVNETAAEFIREKIGMIVNEQRVAEVLKPRDHPVGAKRMCIDIEYFETYNRDNVTLVDVHSAPIERLTATGLQTATAEYEFDVLILATGFDAMTGALLRIDVRGVDGVGIRAKWETGPVTYLGLMTAGFPNLFMVTGPGSPSVLGNVVTSIEQHVEFIAGILEHLSAIGARRIDADADAELRWTEHVDEVAAATLFPTANSWYMGANVPGKPRRFMPYVGGVGNYRAICDKVAANRYTGFVLGTSSETPQRGPLDAFVAIERDLPGSSAAAAAT